MTLFSLFLLDIEAQGNLLLPRFHAHLYITEVSVSGHMVSLLSSVHSAAVLYPHPDYG